MILPKNNLKIASGRHAHGDVIKCQCLCSWVKKEGNRLTGKLSLILFSFIRKNNSYNIPMFRKGNDLILFVAKYSLYSPLL